MKQRRTVFAAGGLVCYCVMASGAVAGPVSNTPSAVDGRKVPVARTAAAATHATTMTTSSMTLDPVTFDDLPGWEQDDHLAAWKAFLASCKPVIAAAKSGARSGPAAAPPGLVDVCKLAILMTAEGKSKSRLEARAFFESYFQPTAVGHTGNPGLLTGYYEPLIKGARQPDTTFSTPVYKRPADLVNMVAESERGAKSAGFTHMRKTAAGLVPYMTRAEIEQGGLNGQHLELMYFKDPVDVFFMQIQGSGRVELPNGEKVRITYDGKNGYPYTSIGRALIDDGTMKPESMSLKSLTSWLKADRARAQHVMWKNQSYVFFRELSGIEAEGAMGALSIPLQPGRSLAVDTAYHALGLPVFVSSPELTHAGKGTGFNRLMIAHDVGSAIKGPERGDIYFGSGDSAGKSAGVTKHPGRFYVMLPNAVALAQMAASGAP